MGRFSSLVVLLLAACGDNLDPDGAGPGPVDEVNPNGTASEVPRYVPSVCGVQSWSANIATTAMNLSVAPHVQGATVLAVPQGGGDMTGFVLDTRMNMIGTPTKIAINEPFEQVAASTLGDRIVSTAVLDGAVFVHQLDPDLGNPQWIAKLPGKFIPEPSFFKTQSDIVMPIAGDDGLTLYRFQDSLEPIDSKLVLATKPATAVTAAQLGVATLTAWSTESDCHMMMLSGFAPGPTGYVNSACPSPRLAVNGTNGEGVMVFESVDGVRLMHTQTTQMGGDARVVRPETSSPRTLFDGTNFWVSFLDARGDVIVGFLDGQRQLVTMSLGGPQPQQDAYELVMVQNEPWVIAVDAGGYTGHRLCVDAQW